MARLGSWGLLCFAVLALPGPPGAGAQGKWMWFGGGAPSSSDFDAGDGPWRVFAGGDGSRRCSPQPSPHLPGLGKLCASLGGGDRGGPVGGGTASMVFKKPPPELGARGPLVLSTAR